MGARAPQYTSGESGSTASVGGFSRGSRETQAQAPKDNGYWKKKALAKQGKQLDGCCQPASRDAAVKIRQ